jgi:hypothetical protein
MTVFTKNLGMKQHICRQAQIFLQNYAILNVAPKKAAQKHYARNSENSFIIKEKIKLNQHYTWPSLAARTLFIGSQCA